MCVFSTVCIPVLLTMTQVKYKCIMVSITVACLYAFVFSVQGVVSYEAVPKAVFEFLEISMEEDGME